MSALSNNRQALRFPSSVSLRLDTFSRLGEGFYSRALCKKVGYSIHLPLPAAPNFRAQPSHPWQRTAQLDARACVARPKGKSEGMTGRSLLQTRQRKIFPAMGHTATLPVCFIPAAFPSTTQVLCFFLDSRKKRPPSFSSSPSPAIKKAKLLLRRKIAIRVSLFHPEAGLAAVH